MHRSNKPEWVAELEWPVLVVKARELIGEYKSKQLDTAIIDACDAFLKLDLEYLKNADQVSFQTHEYFDRYLLSDVQSQLLKSALGEQAIIQRIFGRMENLIYRKQQLDLKKKEYEDVLLKAQKDFAANPEAVQMLTLISDFAIENEKMYALESYYDVIRIISQLRNAVLENKFDHSFSWNVRQAQQTFEMSQVKLFTVNLKRLYDLKEGMSALSRFANNLTDVELKGLYNQIIGHLAVHVAKIKESKEKLPLLDKINEFIGHLMGSANGSSYGLLVQTPDEIRGDFKAIQLRQAQVKFDQSKNEFTKKFSDDHLAKDAAQMVGLELERLMKDEKAISIINIYTSILEQLTQGRLKQPINKGNFLALHQAVRKFQHLEKQDVAKKAYEEKFQEFSNFIETIKQPTVSIFTADQLKQQARAVLDAVKGQIGKTGTNTTRPQYKLMTDMMDTVKSLIEKPEDEENLTRLQCLADRANGTFNLKQTAQFILGIILAIAAAPLILAGVVAALTGLMFTILVPPVGLPVLGGGLAAIALGVGSAIGAAFLMSSGKSGKIESMSIAKEVKHRCPVVVEPCRLFYQTAKKQHDAHNQYQAEISTAAQRRQVFA